MGRGLRRLPARLAAALSALRAARGGAVLELTGGDFEAAVRAHPLLLVEFYAPWCGHCRQLEPEYEKAAEALQGRARLARVDATREAALAEQHRVDGYPTLFFYRAGLSEDYDGGRSSASIVAWVEEHSGPALTVAASESALDSALSRREALPCFVARGGPALREIFSGLADKRRAAGSFLFLEGEGEGEASVQVHRGPEEVVELRGAEALDAERVARFLSDEAMAPFGEISEANFAQYHARATEGIVWVCFAPESFREDARRHAAAFRKIAATFAQFPVVYTDTMLYEDHVREELGCTQFPTVVLQLGNFTDEDQEIEPRRYRLHLRTADGTADAEAVIPWVRAVLAGQVAEDDGLDDLDEADAEADEDALEPDEESDGRQEF